MTVSPILCPGLRPRLSSVRLLCNRWWSFATEVSTSPMFYVALASTPLALAPRSDNISCPPQLRRSPPLPSPRTPQHVLYVPQPTARSSAPRPYTAYRPGLRCRSHVRSTRRLEFALLRGGDLRRFMIVSCPARLLPHKVSRSSRSRRCTSLAHAI
ncbi:hypothetical protein K466DRAFT_85950 [Polyporus arcularius HHB13444]|uniref:Uncharacterized protein n=1 Tax=Polyporus arcularius HHB13444 TaxID=1314778 RepID=A0A5C3NLJ1_9APHY|nr:hypothetical protein K466DRAFT_85950 [Polyporus arcularius HHB13444]